MAYTLYSGIDQLLTLEPVARKQGRHIREEDLGVINRGAILVKNGKIVWVGPRKSLPKKFHQEEIKEIDLDVATVLPGFVECHTHLVFAGDRAAEFEMRNQGASYQEIARRGGGILSTMRQTRSASRQQLLTLAEARAREFVMQGVTTLEVKSGYALNKKDELKMLEVATKLGAQKKAPRVVRTFLGAHALPPEFQSYEDYLTYLAEDVLPVVAQKKWAERVDVFIENGFFPFEASKQYLEKAKSLGFSVVVHADQLSLSGGSEAAMHLKALSADHLVCVGEAQIEKLAQSDVTCVLLPAADLYMKINYPPARALIDAGARVALATDFNPGSSPTQDLILVGLLARLHMKMSLPEVSAAYTVGAAHALDLQEEVGSLSAGKYADFLCTDLEWGRLFYSVGERGMSAVYSRGRCLYRSS